MSYFTLQFTAPNGPILGALVGVSRGRGIALQKAGQKLPTPILIRGLVDTGASGTCLDPSVIASLSLSPTGSVQVCTPSTGNTPHNALQYDVSLMVPGGSQTAQPLVVPNLAVVASQLLQQQGIHALIGRDVLSMCHLTYDGRSGLFTLAY